MSWKPTCRLLCAVLLALLAAVLGTPAAAVAQPLSAVPLNQRPLEWLLEARDTLGLTAEQVARLEQVKTRLDARNGPLIEQLLTLRAAWQQERLALRRARATEDSELLVQLRNRSQQLLMEIQLGNRRAMTMVQGLLTPDQRRLLREMVRERRAAT
jgi:hypothetical protein